MAVVLPFIGYGIFRLVAGSSPVGSRRCVLAAALAGYFGLVVASLAAGLEFGLQPLLHQGADGHALYCPYGMNVAVPAMVLEHLLVFGWVEAVVTAGVVAYLAKHSPEMLKGKGEVS